MSKTMRGMRTRSILLARSSNVVGIGNVSAMQSDELLREGIVVSELNNDASMTPEKARALHRVVRAMHDGNCPKCGSLFDAQEMRDASETSGLGWGCPMCGFQIDESDAELAMRAFRPYMQANLAVFEEWVAEQRNKSND